jgi:hypothetical protein
VHLEPFGCGLVASHGAVWYVGLEQCSWWKDFKVLSERTGPVNRIVDLISPLTIGRYSTRRLRMSTLLGCQRFVLVWEWNCLSLYGVCVWAAIVVTQPGEMCMVKGALEVTETYEMDNRSSNVIDCTVVGVWTLIVATIDRTGATEQNDTRFFDDFPTIAASQWCLSDHHEMQ